MRGRTVLTVLMLIVAAATAALWYRSLDTDDALLVFIGSDGKLQTVISSSGAICVAVTNVGFGHERAWSAMVVPSVRLLNSNLPLDENRIASHALFSNDGSVVPRYLINALTFMTATSTEGAVEGLPKSKLFYVRFPHWLPVVILSTWGVWRLAGPAQRKRRRRAKGQCKHCGYDLRATPDRCPECGAST